MSGYLLVLFLFQSGLAYAFTLFIVRLIRRGSAVEELASFRTGLRWFRNGMGGFACVVPLLVYGAFYASLPTGEDPATAVWPAVWIFCILFAVFVALLQSSMHRTQTQGAENG